MKSHAPQPFYTRILDQSSTYADYGLTQNIYLPEHEERQFHPKREHEQNNSFLRSPG